MNSFNRFLAILCLVAGHASAGIGESPSESLQSLGDINGDGSQDIAVWGYDGGTGTATVKDAGSGASIQSVVFSGSAVANEFMTVPDVNGNGAPELLVLRSAAPQIELRDSLSAELLSTLNFNANFDFVDVAVVPDQDGSGVWELALLGRRAGTGQVKVETRDAVSGNLVANTFFSNGCVPRQLLALPDVDGNAQLGFAVLCVNPGYAKVEIRKTTGALVRAIGLDKTANYLQMVRVADTNGNGAAELALLRSKPSINVLQVLMVDALTGTAGVVVPFSSRFTPVSLIVMPDLNGNGSDELALLGHNPDTGASKVQIRDAATGGLVKDVWFDKAVLPQDLAMISDMNGNGVAELGMLGVSNSDGIQRVFIKDTQSSMEISVVTVGEVAGVMVVDAGTIHTCGLKTDGRISCWGSNYWGQSAPPDMRFSQISAGYLHTCAITGDGEVVCWGSPYLGLTTPPAGRFNQVSAAIYHTCGVRPDGSVECWGGNYEGESNPPAGNFTQISSGTWHTCGLKTDSSVACWGSNTSGQSAPPAGNFSRVSAGGGHTCGLKTDGSVACWGRNDYGQSTAPAGPFSQVEAGEHHTCGLRTDGSVVCWGWNLDGQSSPPAGIFTQISASAGSRHTCGIRVDGTVACWGSNSDGQSTPPPGW